MNNTHLTPAKGFKYLPSIIMEEIELYRKYKDANVHPLVEAVYGYDRSSHYSDSIEVQRNGRHRYEELLVEIGNSPDFTESQKVVLRKGLGLYGDEDLIKEFPELNNSVSYDAEVLDMMLHNGTYDESIIDKVNDALKTLDDVFSSVNIVGAFGTYLIYSKSSKRFTREELLDYRKLALSNKANEKFLSAIKVLTPEVVIQYTEMVKRLQPYVNVGTSTSRNYKSCTLLPERNIFLSIQDDSALVNKELQLLSIYHKGYNFRLATIM